MKLVVVMDSTRPSRVEIGLNHHPHVFTVVFEEQVLNLPNVGKTDGIRVRRPIALHLRKIKRHLGHAPGISPALYQGFHPGRVNPAVTTVAGPLTPDGTADGVRNNRSDLAIEELRRPTPHPGDSREVRSRRLPAPCLCHPPGLFLPCLQIRVVSLIAIAALLRERIRIANEIGVPSEFRMLLNRLALGKGLDACITVGTE